jgi:hypothetical protein
MKTSLMRGVTLAASLCAASNIVIAASPATFTDAWHDTLAGNMNEGYTVNTTSSFSTTISLPLDGVDLSEADAGTQFSLSIGPSGGTIQIVSDTLGDANWSPGKQKATFEIQDPNTLANIGSVTVSWTATTLSVTGSASEDAEDLLGMEMMFAGESTGSPTNYILNTPISGFFAEISVTLDASDNGGGTFNYDNATVPVTGTDKETDPNPDGNGPYPLETGSVTGTVDLTPPSLSITSPSAGFKVYATNPVVNLEGHASDSFGITDIEYYVNDDTNNPTETDQFPGDAGTNSVSWTASVNLSQVGQVGSNVVTVYATDTLGNTNFVSRTFIWSETNSAVVAVNPTIAGKVTGIHNGEVLQIGFGYSVTASSTNKDWIFSDWTDVSGDILSSNVTFEYVDTDGTLTANFVPNPFYNANPAGASDLAGAYTGLFYDTNNRVELTDAGYISVTVTDTGGFSGKLYLASTGSSFSLSGQLAVASNGLIATADLGPIKVNASEYLSVNLQVATDTNLSDPGAGLLGGLVNSYSNATELNLIDSATIQGKLSHANASVSNGLYSFYIPPISSDPSAGPGGWSYGSATVSKNEGVALVFNLGDGTSPAISFSSFLAQDCTCPFYASLYSGNGVIMGWMQFITNGSNTVTSSSVNWVKMPVADKYYTNGFIVTTTLTGNLYLPPKAGTNIFGWTDGTFVVDQGYAGLSLPNEIDDSVTFNPANNTFTDANRVTITFTKTTGALTGKFYYPTNSSASFTYHGVEVDGTGYGFYTSTNKETGPIEIVGPP